MYVQRQAVEHRQILVQVGGYHPQSPAQVRHVPTALVEQAHRRGFISSARQPKERAVDQLDEAGFAAAVWPRMTLCWPASIRSPIRSSTRAPSRTTLASHSSVSGALLPLTRRLFSCPCPCRSSSRRPQSENPGSGAANSRFPSTARRSTGAIPPGAVERRRWAVDPAGR